MTSTDMPSLVERIRHVVDTYTPHLHDNITREDALTLAVYTNLVGMADLAYQLHTGYFSVQDAYVLAGQARETATAVWTRQWGDDPPAP